MFLSPQLRGKRLADLCHRLAISTESGIDIRQTWRREAEHARGRVGQAFTSIRSAVEQGQTLADAVAACGDLFPRLFIEMVHVGEQSGSLAEVLHRLSDHYQRSHTMRRSLRTRLAWPMLELGAAIVIFGGLLAIIATLDLRRVNGKPLDPLGLGFTGMSAVVVYIQVLVVLGLILAGLIIAYRRGWLMFAPVERLIMQLPSIGTALQKICLARLAWALHLTLNVEIDLRRIVPLALSATGSSYYTRWSGHITDLVAAGTPLSEAFAAAGIFPDHFIEALYVAEESGQIVESMARLSRQYEEEADDAMSTLTTIFGFLLTLVVLGVIGVMIIRLFQVVYLDGINDALNL